MKIIIVATLALLFISCSNNADTTTTTFDSTHIITTDTVNSMHNSGSNQALTTDSAATNMGRDTSSRTSDSLGRNSDTSNGRRP